MENNEPKVEVTLPADLAKRYNEATTPEQRIQVLNEFASQRGAEPQNKKEAAAFTQEQFETLIRTIGSSASASAKEAVAEMTRTVGERYNLSDGEAKEIAERSFVSAEDKHRNLRADMEVAANVFRGIFLAGQGKRDAYDRAIAEEAEHYKKRGRQTRAMSLGTDNTGGYLAPTLFSDLMYENISRTSLIRKYAKIIPMNRNEVINFPTMTAGMSAAQVAEAGTASGVKPTFSQKQLTTKKLVSKSQPISMELIEKAHPAIVQLILQHAIIEIQKKEDALVFGTTGNGIRNTSTNLVIVGSAASGYDSIDFDDFITMESELTAEYLAGDDIQGSGIIGGAPQYFLPHALVQAMKKKKEVGTGAYLDEARELRNQKQIFGYNAQRVLSLPDGITPALATDDKVAIFGNLNHVWCGVEGGFRIDIADQGATDNGGSEVNLFDTAQVAVRVMEFFDSVVVDDEAFSIAKMAA